MGNYGYYFKVGKIDEIKRLGFVKTRLLGHDIVVFYHQKDFFAVDVSVNVNKAGQTVKNDEWQFSSAGAINTIRKFLSSPSDRAWARLNHFPVKLEDDFVFVGVSY